MWFNVLIPDEESFLGMVTLDNKELTIGQIKDGKQVSRHYNRAVIFSISDHIAISVIHDDALVLIRLYPQKV